MANFFTLILDTTGPSNPSILIEGGSAFATQQLVTATVSTTDPDTTGYQMKIWGNVDGTHNSNIQATEVGSSWITYSTSQQVKLSTGDGLKTIYLKIRDDVWNESAQVNDTITLDETLPVVTITGPDVSKISKIASKNTSSFSFQVDVPFTEYKVKVVSASGASHDTGAQIGIVNGSTNMSATGSFAANTPINCSIKGSDLEAASAGDTTKIIKVFVFDGANWSV